MLEEWSLTCIPHLVPELTMVGSFHDYPQQIWELVVQKWHLFKKLHVNAGLPLHQVQKGIPRWTPHLAGVSFSDWSDARTLGYYPCPGLLLGGWGGRICWLCWEALPGFFSGVVGSALLLGTTQKAKVPSHFLWINLRPWCPRNLTSTSYQICPLSTLSIPSLSFTESRHEDLFLG